jgi:hypothetical protein
LIGVGHEYRKISIGKAPQIAVRKAKGNIGLC